MAAPDAAVTFEVNPNAFARCAPAISTNIRQCGSVTVCNMKPMTVNDLSGAFMKSGQFRVMRALFKHDIELKMCAPVQNGLYDFLMANKVNLNKKVQSEGHPDEGELAIVPFIKAKRYHPINNSYWAITNGEVDRSDEDNWVVRVASTTNIPADVRSFPPGMPVFAQGVSAGGSATRTAWTIVSSVLANDGSYVTLTLEDMNAGSHLSADKLGPPVSGLLTRGSPNKNDYESWCAEQPAYRNWTKFPFFFQTTRNSFCWSEHYQKWRREALKNELYEEFFDLSDTERNRQIGADYQRRFVENFFWQKPISNFQTLHDYDKLDPIPSFDPSEIGLDGFGVDGGRCVGYRANATGFYDQMAECGRVFDMQGATPYLRDLAILLYNMKRVKQGRGHPNPNSFDLFTDSVSAYDLNTAFIAYYKVEGQDMLRINVEAGKFGNQKKAEFGFSYTTYTFFWPQAVTVNVITHEFFDDWNTATAAAVAAGASASFANTSRVWWIIDWPSVYPGIIASNRVVNKTGDLKTLAAIDPKGYGCVMKVHTQEQTLMSMTYTVILDCPTSNAIIENIGPIRSNIDKRCVPNPKEAPLGTFGTIGGGDTTTTTSTTGAVVGNDAQTANWTDHNNVTHTVRIAEGTFHAAVGQQYFSIDGNPHSTPQTVTDAKAAANADAQDAANAEAARLTIEDAVPSQTQVGP